MQTELNTSDFNEIISQLTARYTVFGKPGENVNIEGDILY